MSTATSQQRKNPRDFLPWIEAEEKALCEGEYRVRNGLMPLNLPYKWDEVPWYIDARMREVDQSREGLRTLSACRKHYSDQREKKFADMVIDVFATANYIPPSMPKTNRARYQS